MAEAETPATCMSEEVGSLHEEAEQLDPVDDDEFFEFDPTEAAGTSDFGMFSSDDDDWEEEEATATTMEWLEHQLAESERTIAYTQRYFSREARSDPAVLAMQRAYMTSLLIWCTKAFAAYQNVGTQWMMIREWLVDPSVGLLVRGGILCDDTGLGKTYQLVRLIMSDFGTKLLGKADVSHLQTLIIAPKALLTQWEEEIKKFTEPDCEESADGDGASAASAMSETKRRFVGKVGKFQQRFIKKIDSFKGIDTIEDYVGIVIVSYSAFKTPLQECRGKKARHQMHFGDVPKVLKRTVVRTADGQMQEVDKVWNRIILDEGHEIRNRKTRVHDEICKLTARKKWVATATPVQNGTDDLRSLASFIGISPSVDIEYIRKHYVLRRIAEVEKHKAELERQAQGRPDATSLLDQLPKVRCRVKRLAFVSEQEKAIYEAVKGAMDGITCAGSASAETLLVPDAAPPNANAQKHNIIRYIMFLRQICVDARIFVQGELKRALGKEIEESRPRDSSCYNSEAPKSDDDDSSDDEGADSLSPAAPNGSRQAVLQRYNISDSDAFFATMSTKVAYLANKLLRLHEKNMLQPPELHEKAVVFCEWHSEMNLISEALQKDGVSHGLYKGTMSLQQRSTVLQKFEMHATMSNVLLIQIRSGSEGLNLQMANHLYIMSPTWNPCKEMQAIGRVVRLSQKSDRRVTITRIIISGTVEERCLEIQEQKKAIVHRAMKDNSMSVRLGNALTKAEIEKICCNMRDNFELGKPSCKKGGASSKAYTEGKWSDLMRRSGHCDAIAVVHSPAAPTCGAGGPQTAAARPSAAMIAVERIKVHETVDVS